MVRLIFGDRMEFLTPREVQGRRVEFVGFLVTFASRRNGTRNPTYFYGESFTNPRQGVCLRSDPFIVMPAQAGIQSLVSQCLDSGLRRNDRVKNGFWDSLQAVGYRA